MYRQRDINLSSVARCGSATGKPWLCRQVCTSRHALFCAKPQRQPLVYPSSTPPPACQTVLRERFSRGCTWREREDLSPSPPLCWLRAADDACWVNAHRYPCVKQTSAGPHHCQNFDISRKNCCKRGGRGGLWLGVVRVFKPCFSAIRATSVIIMVSAQLLHSNKGACWWWFN